MGKFGDGGLCFHVEGGLFFHCEADYAVQGQTLLPQHAALIIGRVSLSLDFPQSRLSILQNCRFCLLLIEFGLQSFVFLHQKDEGVFQVLVRVLKHLVVLAEVVYEVFDEVEVVGVEWR